MIALDNQPHLIELKSLIEKVPSYPIDVKQLTGLAKQQGFAKEVIAFYKAFPPDQIFNDKEDLISRTEAVEILHHQEAPPEQWRSPEED